jgi:hypothetical protein
MSHEPIGVEHFLAEIKHFSDRKVKLSSQTKPQTPLNLVGIISAERRRNTSLFLTLSWWLCMPLLTGSCHLPSYPRVTFDLSQRNFWLNYLANRNRNESSLKNNCALLSSSSSRKYRPRHDINVYLSLENVFISQAESTVMHKFGNCCIRRPKIKYRIPVGHLWSDSKHWLQL